MRALLLLVSAQALAPSRRTFLVAAAGGAASASTDGVVQQITLPEAVKAIITDANPDWVRAVVQAGFIYRGVAETGPTLRRDAYDLYASATYNSAKAAGYFRSLDAALDTNVRLRWEYVPGSELFVVYSDGRRTRYDGVSGLRNRSLVVKLTRLLRF